MLPPNVPTLPRRYYKIDNQTAAGRFGKGRRGHALSTIVMRNL